MTYLALTHGASGIINYIHKNGLHSGTCIQCDKQPDNPSGLQHDQILPSSTALWNECRTLALEIATLRELVRRHDIAGIWVAFLSRCQRYRC